MKNLYTLVVATVLAVNATPTFAQDLSWELLSARSVGKDLSCSPDDVQMIAAGNNLSLVFGNMNVNLPAGSENRKRLAYGRCVVSLSLVIPQGSYLTSMSGDIFGGVEKSRGSRGYIDASMHLVRYVNSLVPAFAGLGPQGEVLDFLGNFRPNQEISEPLLQLHDQREFSNHQMRTMCEWTKRNPVKLGMLVRLNVAGARQNANQTTIINVDGADTNVEMGISTGSCRS